MKISEFEICGEIKEMELEPNRQAYH